MSKIRRAASAAKSMFDPAQHRAELDRFRRLNNKLERTVARLEKRALAGKPGLPADMDEEAREIIRLVRPYTMTSAEKVFALITAVRHVARVNLPGDFVECGVWRGGSVHAVARTLVNLGITDRELHLFDTFTGMTEPTERDRRGDTSAADLLQRADKSQNVWAIASLEDVKEGVAALDYPQERFHFVQGPVEETIPGSAPETIALLRLDTDWYESTKHELEHLYDRLVPGGVLIMDDYGSWQGAKEATDEYMATLDNPPMMTRAGRGRIGIKPA
ncbi:MAG: TylF/MycF/NovP-related O-methyltransferase [Marmoricola sp.]